MKQILIDSYGSPEEVARCAEVPDVGVRAARALSSKSRDRRIWTIARLV